MKKRAIWSYTLLCLIFVQGCDLFNQEPELRGTIVSQTKIKSNSRDEVNAAFAANLPLATASYGVDTYKIIYNTIDPAGNPTTASGIVQIPTGTSIKGFTMLAELHGTVTRDADVPSRSSFYQVLTAVYASTGYITVAPDYLGLGDSTYPLHPFVQYKPTVTATVDLMRAAKKLCAELNLKLNGKVLVSGYSQGGYSAMAVHKGLESDYSKEFEVIGSTPMAGPYSLSGVSANMILSGNTHPNPFYFAYVMLAYNQVYQYATSASGILKSPYDTTIPPMFNRNTSGSAINGALPTIPINMLNTTFEQDFRNNANNGLRKALAENDLVNWHPKAPIHLFHCGGDVDVPITNSQMAYEQLKANGAQIEFTIPSQTATHGGCFVPSFMASKVWLDTQLAKIGS